MLYLEALAWKARERGISYGKLSVALTPEEAEAAVTEYRKLCRRRQDEEELRLRQAKEGRSKKK